MPGSRGSRWRAERVGWRCLAVPVSSGFIYSPVKIPETTTFEKMLFCESAVLNVVLWPSVMNARGSWDQRRPFEKCLQGVREHGHPQSPALIEQCTPLTPAGLALLVAERTGLSGVLWELSQAVCG